MKQFKEYVSNPTQEEIEFFGYEKDDVGYYFWNVAYDNEDEKLRANNQAWSEYWKQFSKDELVSAML